MSATLEAAEGRSKEAVDRMEDLDARIQALPDDAKPEEVEFYSDEFRKAKEEAARWAETVTRQKAIIDERQKVRPQASDEPGAEPKSVDVKEPLTYREKGTFSFFRDLRDAGRGDSEAQSRLQRHAREMQVEMRDLSSTAGAGGEFIPPLWLQNQWVELLRSTRPTADVVTKFPLPQGTNSINLPKLSGGGATAIQTADNAAVQETDPTTTSVTAGVKTIAGQIDMSRQLFEFSQPGLDQVLFRDLARDYGTKIDIQVLSGSGAAGQALGIRNVGSINAVTYTDATPTVAEAWPKITDAIQRITTGFLNPDTVVMHPRRAGWFLAATDSAGRPLFNAGSPVNSMGEISGTVANGFAGGLQGMRVVIDPNLPTNLGAGTNEDVILVFDSSQVYLWEEAAPRTRVFEDVGSGTLTVRLSCYGFFAFMANRYPVGISTITGTGLIAPTF